MRSHFSRLSYAGVVLFALTACSDATNGLPPTGSPNATGGGVVNTNPGVGTVPANSVPPKLIDDGTVAKGKYSGFNATATDTQSPIEVASDPSSGLPNPVSPSGPTDGGSHSIAFSGNGSTQVILGYGGTVPNLTYTFGQSGNATNYNFGSIALHASYAPGTTTPGTLSAVAVEFTGGTGSSAFDVRVPCTLPTAGLPATLATATSATSLVTCSPLPAYPTAGFLPTNPDTLGPNAVTPGVTGQFTPTAPKLYLVLTYSGPTATAGTATLGIDDVYAKQ